MPETNPAPTVPSSQGSTVIFDGDQLGKLTGWSLEAGKAITADITTADSERFGSAGDTRILRQLDCVGIEPGKFTVRLFGCPPYTVSQIGSKGGLSVTFSGGGITAEAILDGFNVDGAVGELLVGQATFILTGTAGA